MKRILLLFALLLTVGVAYAQTHDVTGKILDENGNGYPGAGITVKGTHVGTISDANGDFSLEVPDGKGEFTIQAVGYTTQTVRDNGQLLVVRLNPTAKELEGTVVTALGIRREKRELGYNTTTVDAEDLTAGQGTSALTDLAGKVAGANISSSTGGPGGDTRIILRGEKSIEKDNNALIVVDGVITNNFDRVSDPSNLAQIDFGNSANDLDPDEIESVTVLNGPAAAALYGAKGANGAIIITTKKGKHTAGKYNKMDVTYKASYTQSDVLKYPQYQTEFGLGAPGIIDDRPDNFSWGPAFDGHLAPWGQIIDGQQQVKPYSAISSTPEDEFYNHGKDLNNFVSISGGTETSTYYLSLNSLNSSGIIPYTGLNKYSIRFNGHTDLGNHFYSEININYINSDSRAAAQGQSTGGIEQSLLQIPVDIPIASLSNLNNHFNSMDFVDTAGINRYGYRGAFAANPYWMAEYYNNQNKTDRVLGDVVLGYKKGDFNVYDRVGADVSDNRSYYQTPEIDAVSVDQTSYYSQYPYVNTGGYQETAYTGLRIYNDLIANYTHALTNNFGINATLGNNTTLQNDETLLTQINPKTNGLAIPGYYNFTNNTGPLYSDNTLQQYRTQAIYGDVRFNFQKEVFLDITGRNEWSSTLQQNQDSYFYPGANAAWVFTERLKGKIRDILNYGKVRMGVAGVSSDALAYANNPAIYNQNPIQSPFGTVQPPFNALPALTIGSVFGPANLKPELTHEYETGTDLSFLKNRLTISATYYDDLTKNLISLISLPPSTGYSGQYINVGDVSNKGVELSARGTPISTKWGLKWDLFATYTYNVNNVVSLNNDSTKVTIGGFQGMEEVAAVGHPLGTFYAADITYEHDASGWHPVVDPGTGLPVPTSKPVFLGSYQPKFQASWGTDLSYKGIKLHVLFTTKQGGQFYDQNKELMDFVGSAPETTISNRNPLYWPNSVYIQPGTGVTTPPVYVANNANAPNGGAKYLPYNYWEAEVGQGNLPAQNLINASYIRLQEASLGYKIPQKYYTKSPFGSLEAGIFGNNLLLWTPKSNKYDDPEENTSGAISNVQGFNYSANPSLRNYGVYLKVTF